ncbi:MAG: hypothetical protein JSV88_08345, partial [Candidatus Aminicenantes bacterium]
EVFFGKKSAYRVIFLNISSGSKLENPYQIKLYPVGTELAFYDSKCDSGHFKLTKKEVKMNKEVKKEQTNFKKFETLSKQELSLLRGGDGENVSTDDDEG